ncbi:MAG: NAD(P)/FAD-dependent oxidoreductase [Methylococcaceae bacterium]
MNTASSTEKRPKIVVVGGGAGGLELVTQLGKTLGRTRKADITLIDATRTHIWKPLLHEVAAGTLDSHDDELDYLAQASGHHFRFVLGRMEGLDRLNKHIRLAPLLNARGEEIMPSRDYPYDILVVAVGSVCNDFGITGVAEHCQFLDTTEQASDFQNRWVEAYFHAHAMGGARESGQLDVAIIGGGATGIELSAQLHLATHLLSAYGLDNVTPSDIQIHLIEAAPTLLPGLPERLSRATQQQLSRLGVQIHLGERVVEITSGAVHTQSGRVIPAALKVWAAGVKAPDFLRDLAGLETNRINQLQVRLTLQTTLDDDIFAIGDCCSCPWPEKNSFVPPRAQSAHQQASLALKNITRKLSGQALADYHYQDYGSLVSLGKYSTVGNLMGNLMGSVMIEGMMARLVYLSLYKMHQWAIFGPGRVMMLMISGFFRKRLRPRIKLH